jgi:hypothetical protein
MAQSSDIVHPAQWADIELKDVRVSVLETVSAIASMRSADSGLLVSSAVFLFDDLGADERLVVWELFLFREEEPPFSDFVRALDDVFGGAKEISEHDPIPAAAFQKLQEKARKLLSIMEAHGWHEFRAG